MNIVIDQGNTSTKAAVFDERKMLSSFIFKPLTASKLLRLLNEFSPSKGILCSVTAIKPEIVSILEKRLIHFVVLDESLPLPIQSVYRTPETLGKDRIAAVVGAWTQYPGKSILVIDAGSAITYDFIDASGIYKGGNISPGMTMRFKALNAYTDRLPLLNECGELLDLGTDTETAIRSGVISGIIKEIDAYIGDFKRKYPDLLVFLTGGHSFYFETKLKNSIFADGNLVLLGLNEILNYQNY